MQILDGCDLNFDTKSHNCQNCKHQCCLKCVDEYMLIRPPPPKKKKERKCTRTENRPARCAPHPICQTPTTQQQHQTVTTCSDKVWSTAAVLENVGSSLSQQFHSSVLGVTQHQNFFFFALHVKLQQLLPRLVSCCQLMLR